MYMYKYIDILEYSEILSRVQYRVEGAAVFNQQPKFKTQYIIPSKIEWDLTNGPLSKLLELLDTQVRGSVQWVLLEISWNNP